MAKTIVMDLNKSNIKVLYNILDVTYVTIKDFKFDWNYDFYNVEEHKTTVLLQDDGSMKELKKYMMKDKIISAIQEIHSVVKKAMKKKQKTIELTTKQISILHYVLNIMPDYFQFVYDRYKDIANWYTKEYIHVLEKLGVTKKFYSEKGISVIRKINDMDAYGMKLHIKHPVCETAWYKNYLMCNKCLRDLHIVKEIMETI